MAGHEHNMIGLALYLSEKLTLYVILNEWYRGPIAQLVSASAKGGRSESGRLAQFG